MMKKIFYLLIITSIYSCSSESTNQDDPQVSNTLIIKQINDVRENNELIYYFDTSGRLDSVTDSEALDVYNNILSKYEYSNDNKLIESYHTLGTEEWFSTLTYSENNIVNYEYSTLGAFTNSPVTISENLVSYFDQFGDNGFNDEGADVELTFDTNNLENVVERKSTLTNPSGTICRITNNMYTNNNLIETNYPTSFCNSIDETITYTYDDKKNAIAESMSNYKLALSFLTLYTFPMSTNNILTQTSSNTGITKTYEYIYNSDDYPISAIATNLNSGEVTNTLTYIYY